MDLILNINLLLPDSKDSFTSFNNPYIQEKIEDIFDDKLFQDVNDIYSRNNSQNRYYTMPNTDIVNKQTEFAKWCYKTPPTCKEGNDLQCTVDTGNSGEIRMPPPGKAS